MYSNKTWLSGIYYPTRYSLCNDQNSAKTEQPVLNNTQDGLFNILICIKLIACLTYPQALILAQRQFAYPLFRLY